MTRLGWLLLVLLPWAGIAVLSGAYVGLRGRVLAMGRDFEGVVEGAWDAKEAVQEHIRWAEWEVERLHEATVQRCTWEVVPRRTREEVVTAVRLWASGDQPVLVDIAR